jgi:hypothetical protein
VGLTRFGGHLILCRQALQELAGWKCVETVRKYAHLSTAHLTEDVDRVSQLRLVASEGVATIQLHAQK